MGWSKGWVPRSDNGTMLVDIACRRRPTDNVDKGLNNQKNLPLARRLSVRAMPVRILNSYAAQKTHNVIAPTLGGTSWNND